MTAPVVIGRARLYLGDCFDLLDSLDAADIGSVITDPPYGININHQNLGIGARDFYRGGQWDNAAPDIRPFLRLGKFHCFWGGNYFADLLPPNNDWLIWHKLNDGRSFSECEMAWTNYGKNTRHLSHHWGGEKKSHPTMKPLRVMQWSIAMCPLQTAAILDPFMGSGTTGVAAVQMGRGFIGIEREQRYFELACQRIEQAQRQTGLMLPDPVRVSPVQMEVLL